MYLSRRGDFLLSGGFPRRGNITTAKIKKEITDRIIKKKWLRTSNASALKRRKLRYRINFLFFALQYVSSFKKIK